MRTISNLRKNIDNEIEKTSRCKSFYVHFIHARTGKITFKNQDFRGIETLTSPPVKINLRKTTKALWFNTKEYKPIGFKTKMLKNFDDFLDDAFKSMKSDEKLIIKDFPTWRVQVRASIFIR